MASHQKIVIMLPSCDDRCRSRAMKIAATADGTVTSVSIQGGDRDHLVVIGEGIDTVNLTKSLRKKFPNASVVSVQPITSSPERSTLNRYNYNTVQSTDYYRPHYHDYNTYQSTEYYRPHYQYQWPSSTYYDNYPREHREAYDSSPGDCTIV